MARKELPWSTITTSRNRSTPRRPRRSAPPEEFLYLACLHEGTGGRRARLPRRGRRRGRPGRPRDADAERRRRAAPLRLEPLQLGVPRARSLASDRARLPLVADPRRSTSPTTRAGPDREGHRAARSSSRRPATRGPHTVHCMPGDNIVVSMLGDRDGGGAGGFAVLDARTFEVKGRWENGGERRPSTTTSGTSRARTCLISSEFGEPNAYERGFDIDDVGGRALRAAAALLGPRRAAARADARPRRGGAGPARGALAARPRRRGGLRRRGPVEQRCCASTAPTALPRPSR